MKKILNVNQKLRLVPEDVLEITQGIITSIGAEKFGVMLENEETAQKFFNKEIEVLLSTQNYLLKFKTIPSYIKGSVLYIDYTSEYHKIQRREYSRVNLTLPVKCLSLKNNVSFDAEAVNLSGGGMLISSEIELNEGDLVDVKIEIRKNKFIDAVFEVLRIKQYSENNMYLTAGIFKKISNTDRITIVQLCFKRQLELRCKGFNCTTVNLSNSDGGEHY